MLEVVVHEEPLDADGRTGVVVIDLPDGQQITLSIDAAEQSSLRLLEAATLARLPPRHR